MSLFGSEPCASRIPVDSYFRLRELRSYYEGHKGVRTATNQRYNGPSFGHSNGRDDGSFPRDRHGPTRAIVSIIVSRPRNDR
jgi:hypothetical protein